ncbi:hypothetical protein HW555_008175 [Spodoptera exigua]|uniref:Uncharacterized protein n=1 Tax=Spodoptera exigua TaxID=7107 RepID=A0A835GFN7_SPOEX|nr:hypothetical protein HW555_008175 [Spodoptera exigua]
MSYETSNESSVVQPQQNDSSHSFADDTIKRPRKNLNNEMISHALNIMKSVSDRQNQTQEKDEDTLFGEYIAAKLRKMDKSTNAIAPCALAVNREGG